MTQAHVIYVKLLVVIVTAFQGSHCYSRLRSIKRKRRHFVSANKVRSVNKYDERSRQVRKYIFFGMVYIAVLYESVFARVIHLDTTENLCGQHVNFTDDRHQYSFRDAEQISIGEILRSLSLFSLISQRFNIIW